MSCPICRPMALGIAFGSRARSFNGCFKVVLETAGCQFGICRQFNVARLTDSAQGTEVVRMEGAAPSRQLTAALVKAQRAGGAALVPAAVMLAASTQAAWAQSQVSNRVIVVGAF